MEDALRSWLCRSYCSECEKGSEVQFSTGQLLVWEHDWIVWRRGVSHASGSIKGEIARQAANLVAEDDGYARVCHGELFTVPHANLAGWVREAERVVVIDGCSLFCHSRIAENIIPKGRLVVFDAPFIHRKYSDLMAVNDVPEEERKKAASDVADFVLASISGTENEQIHPGQSTFNCCVNESGGDCSCRA